MGVQPGSMTLVQFRPRICERLVFTLVVGCEASNAMLRPVSDSFAVTSSIPGYVVDRW